MSNLFFLENPPRRFGYKSGSTVPPPIWFVNLNPAFREGFISSSYCVPSYADWHKISPNLRRVPPPCNRAVDVYTRYRCSPALSPPLDLYRLRYDVATLPDRTPFMWVPSWGWEAQNPENVETDASDLLIFAKSPEFYSNFFVYWSCVLGFGTLAGAI